MSNLTTFKSAGLPAVQDLAKALRANLSKTADVGVVIAKMDKTGHWTFGADQTGVEKDSEWAINPFSFAHGFVAWGAGQLLGEKMVSVTQPLPALEAAPDGAPKGWEQQIGFAMKCMSGSDEGLEARFATASLGGKRAVQELGTDVSEHIIADPSTPVAIVKLKSSHYVHDKFGKIFIPEFEILSWVSMDGGSDEEQPELELDEPPMVDEVEAVAPTRRRRAV